jgi:hypothetical protein
MRANPISGYFHYVTSITKICQARCVAGHRSIRYVSRSTKRHKAQTCAPRAFIFTHSAAHYLGEMEGVDPVQENQRVFDMALEVLTRQASGRAKQTEEPFEEALKAVLDTDAGRQLGELRDGPLRDESAQQWQEDLPRKRANERRQARREERRQAQQEERRQARLAAWQAFMQAERRELELRKDGQLAKMLGEPLPGEPPAMVQRLASEDRRQAEERLVALISTERHSIST